MATLIAFFLFLFALGTACFFVIIGTVIPIWTFYDLAISELPKKKKTYWVLGCVFFWSIGSLAYGVTATTSVWLKRVSSGCAVILIAFFALTGLTSYFSSTPRIALQVAREMLRSPSVSTQKPPAIPTPPAEPSKIAQEPAAPERIPTAVENEQALEVISK